MLLGELIEFGSLPDIFVAPSDPRTQRFVTATWFADALDGPNCWAREKVGRRAPAGRDVVIEGLA